ncbi:D-2-hydroxyacid dehydrogenase [Thalassotalea maritima]|uniref:D-2-hydroxyacid dehydrogenase n=1 Tax=Thalassotalea maritima TaxID=3242416 RepID=UPI00352844AA
MKAVFLDRSTISDKINFNNLEQCFHTVSYFDHSSSEKVVSRCRFADVIITNKVIISADMMSQLPKLRLICIAATGTNNVDLVAAKRHGIAVCNVSGYSTSSVSQYVFAMLLEHMQKSSEYIASVRTDKWQNSPVFCHFESPIEELAGQTIALIGYGEIARAVERIARAFSMQVIIAERQHESRIRPGRVAFEQALAQADVVSLHAPLSAATENLINAETLALMKRSAILINTARGGLVNSEHLLSALKLKRIKAAILDVLENEPPNADHPLIAHKLDNLYITGHIAWGSQQAQQRLIDGIADNIIAFQQGLVRNRVD